MQSEYSGASCTLKYLVLEFEDLRTLQFEYILCAAAASMVLLVSESEKGLQAINQIATIHHFRTMLP